MNLKSSLVVCGLILLVALMVRAQSNQKPSSPERYKLVPAQVAEEVDDAGNRVPVPSVFLLDSETGQVWRLQPGWMFKSKDGKQVPVSDQFFAVGVNSK